LETAFRYLAMAGYDGIELSAIDGMSEHLVLDRWRDLAGDQAAFHDLRADAASDRATFTRRRHDGEGDASGG
jgi:hypothetical protein